MTSKGLSFFFQIRGLLSLSCPDHYCVSRIEVEGKER